MENKGIMKESEKKLERLLCVEVKNKLKGWAIKFLPFQVSGLPDRIVLLPQGRMLFVEVKTTGEKTRPIQEVIHRKLRNLGFRVEVVDTSEQITKLINEYR